MTRLLCMRLGTGLSGATLVTCILRGGSPRPQADMWSSWSAEKFDFCIAEPNGVGGRRGYRPVDAEHRNLEGVAGPDRIAEHDAVGHVEALDRGRARPAGRARQLSIDPHLRVIIDVDGEYRF